MDLDKSSCARVLVGALFPWLTFSGCGGGNDAPAAAGPAPAQVAPVDVPPAEDHPAAPTPEPAAPLAEVVASAQPGRAVEAPVDTPSATAVTETLKLAVTTTALVSGTINAAPYWPVWYGTGKPVDGVNCLVNGNYHKHALISIYNNGKRLGFPDGIGRVHAGCYHAYEMHTHDVTGIIHMEADVPKVFKLGQWFSLWKQPLSRNGVAGLPGPVRFYIIENATLTRYDGDPLQIEMRPHREVLIVTGSTMTVVPKYIWPAGI